VVASPKWNWPVITATKANRNTISEEASFSRLSPCIMLSSDFGTFTCFIIVVAETASGGEMIPPKRKPSASVKPGIKELETKATTVDVRITMGKAKLVMTRPPFPEFFPGYLPCGFIQQRWKENKEYPFGVNGHM
jgi:hypothetical protein